VRCQISWTFGAKPAINQVGDYQITRPADQSVIPWKIIIMRNRRFRFPVCIFLLLAGNLSALAVAHAKEEESPFMFQFMVGRMIIANDTNQVKGGDYNIPLLGVAAQKSLGGSMLQYGLETGGLFNWQSEVRSFSISNGGEGGSVAVSLDINAFLFDYFFGVYSSIEPVKWLRLYLGAGPLIIYGNRRTEHINPLTSGEESIYDSGLGFGGYIRGGLELIFSDQVIFSIGGRGIQTGLSLKNTSGEVDMDGWQYFGGMSIRY